MKFGFRTPSFKRSLSAATKGAAKRALMREIVPYYGKRGMGWANPKKAAYNHLYNMTTANPIDLVLGGHSSREPNHSNPCNIEIQQKSPVKAREGKPRYIGLEQCAVLASLVRLVLDEITTSSVKIDAIKQLNSYKSDYVEQAKKNKPCNLNFCDTCDKRLSYENRIGAHAIKMASKIVEAIRLNMSAEDIYKVISEAKSAENIVFVYKMPIETYNICPTSKHYANRETLPIWQRILLGIGLVAGIFLVIWIIAEFVFPAILLGLIFISFLFSKW